MIWKLWSNAISLWRNEFLMWSCVLNPFSVLFLWIFFKNYWKMWCRLFVLSRSLIFARRRKALCNWMVSEILNIWMWRRVVFWWRMFSFMWRKVVKRTCISADAKSHYFLLKLHIFLMKKVIPTMTDFCKADPNVVFVWRGIIIKWRMLRNVIFMWSS